MMPGSSTKKCFRFGGNDKCQILLAVMSWLSWTKLMNEWAPIQANRVLALVRKVFNWAISRDLLEYNPCIQVKPPGKEQQRDRVLHEDEISAVWAAFG